MKHYLLIILAILTLIPLDAQTTDPQENVGIDVSGNRYLDICSVAEKPYDQWTSVDAVDDGACQGFMIGMVDGMTYAPKILKYANNYPSLKGSIKDLGICFPADVETGQMTRIALKFVRDNPEKAHERTPVLVISALQKAFPCGGANP